jgi:hypothetical protein
MEEDQSRRVKVTINTEDMPAPIFANHIQAMSANEFTTLTFYAGLFHMAYESNDDLPDEVEARPVAQIVVPQRLWEQLLGNIFAKRAEQE